MLCHNSVPFNSLFKQLTQLLDFLLYAMVPIIYYVDNDNSSGFELIWDRVRFLNRGEMQLGVVYQVVAGLFSKFRWL